VGLLPIYLAKKWSKETKAGSKKRAGGDLRLKFREREKGPVRTGKMRRRRRDALFERESWKGKLQRTHNPRGKKKKKKKKRGA